MNDSDKKDSTGLAHDWLNRLCPDVDAGHDLGDCLVKSDKDFKAIRRAMLKAHFSWIADHLDDIVKNDAADIKYRFGGDIHDYGDTMYSKYVLIMGRGNHDAHTDDWGVVLVAVPDMSYRALVGSYAKTVGMDPDDLLVLGGGNIAVKWDISDKKMLTISVTNTTDIKPPKSMAAVKACIDSFLVDYHPWVLDKVRYDLPD